MPPRALFVIWMETGNAIARRLEEAGESGEGRLKRKVSSHRREIVMVDRVDSESIESNRSNTDQRTHLSGRRLVDFHPSFLEISGLSR